MARPSEFSPETANLICERIADGESLRKICEDDEMPDRTTVRRWLSQNEAFRLQYAHAREEQADYYAERIVDDAMSASDASIGRLRMDALKWAASKLAPKRYGDKVALTGGSEDDAPLKNELTVRFV